jgi:hypothetical protein
MPTSRIIWRAVTTVLDVNREPTVHDRKFDQLFARGREDVLPLEAHGTIVPDDDPRARPPDGRARG